MKLNNLYRLAALPAVILFSINTYAQTADNYKPPYFADTSRTSKIMAVMPLIQKLYENFAIQNHIPGFVFGIITDGKLLQSGSVGYSSLNEKIQADVRTDFRIASMSKSFTAMAIMQLRDKGKLNLDDPASKYLPEMSKLKYLTEDAAPVTIRQLLSHSAGFPEDNPWGDRQLQDKDQQLKDHVSGGISFSNVPGVQYEYSNLGFALLGQIINRVSGVPYQQYIKEHIWQPLGMTHTYWEYTKVPHDRLAHGYRWINEQWKEEPLLHDGSFGAMGGIITTMEDFSRYMALHLSAWPPRNDVESPVLKRSSLREMQQPWRFSSLNAKYTYPGTSTYCPMVSAYCFGLRWTNDCKGRITVGHSGGLPGFGSNWIILPEYGIGLVCFANRTYAPTTGINMQVMDTLLAVTGLQPRQVPPSFILNKRKNELLHLLPEWNHAQQSGIFAENFFEDYPIDSLRKEALNLFARAGKIVHISDITAENQLRGSFIMEGEKCKLMINFTLSPENPPLVQEYHIREVK